jgi:hypothetical protein
MADMIKLVITTMNGTELPPILLSSHIYRTRFGSVRQKNSEGLPTGHVEITDNAGDIHRINLDNIVHFRASKV